MNLGKTVLIKDNFLSYFFHVNTYLKHSENFCHFLHVLPYAYNRYNRNSIVVCISI